MDTPPSSPRHELERFEASTLAADQAESHELDEWSRMLAERPDAVAPGVDPVPVLAVDPSFNPLQFIAIARESFLVVHRARTAEQPAVAEGLLNDDLAADLAAAVQGDVAAHQRHVYAGIEIRSAVITSATATDGKLTVGVRFHVTSAEYDLDREAKVIGGDETAKAWDEDWTFWRDPTIDPTATDRDHAYRREAAGGWLFAHNGWIVTAIARP
jgi:predicted lipid-binding transport protein (Tim44 family)